MQFAEKIQILTNITVYIDIITVAIVFGLLYDFSI